MAVKINGTPVIDSVSGNIELQNVVSITYPDASVQTSASGSGAPNLDDYNTSSELHSIRRTVFANGLDVTDQLNKLHQVVKPAKPNEWIFSNNNLLTTGSIHKGVVDGHLYARVFAYQNNKASWADVIDIETGQIVSHVEDPDYGSGNYYGWGRAVALNSELKIMLITASGYLSYGRIYVYDISTNPATQVRVITPTLPANFGYSIDMDEGGQFVVGGLEVYSNGGSIAFGNINSSSLIYITGVLPTGSALGYYSVSIDNGFALIGASGANGGQGKALLFYTGFQLPFGAVSVVRTLDPSTGDTDYIPSTAAYGRSVSISGRYCVVGAPSETSENYYSNSGVVRVYDTNTGNLIQKIHNPNDYSTPSYNNFGYHVSVHNDRIASSAYAESSSSTISSGRGYIFDANSGNKLVSISGESNYYNLGKYSVSITKNYALFMGNTEGTTNDAIERITQYSPITVIDKLLAMR